VIATCGVERGAWFLGLHGFTKHVKVAFFRGAWMTAAPPGASKQADVRYLHVREGEALDEDTFVAWVRQAAALPGEKM